MRNMVPFNLIVAGLSMCGILTSSAPNGAINVEGLQTLFGSTPLPNNIPSTFIANFPLPTQPAKRKGEVKESKTCKNITVMEEKTEWDYGNVCQNITIQQCNKIYATAYKLEKQKCMVEYHKHCNSTSILEVKTYNITMCEEFKRDCNTTNPKGICSTSNETVRCETTYQEYETVELLPDCLEQKVPLCDHNANDTKSCSYLKSPCEEKMVFTKKVVPTMTCKVMPKEACDPEGCQIKGERKCWTFQRSFIHLPYSEKCALVPTPTSKNCTKESQMVLVPYLVPKESCVLLPKELCNTTVSNPRTVLQPVTKQLCEPADNEVDISGEDETSKSSPCSNICPDILASEFVSNSTSELCSRQEKPTCEYICPAVMEYAHGLKAHPGHLTPLSYCETCAKAGCGVSLADMAACFSSGGICRSISRITEESPTCSTSFCDDACKDSKDPSTCRKCFKAGCTDRKSNLQACETLKTCTVG